MMTEKMNVLRVAALLALSVTVTSAFTTPLMATRAVVKKAPAKAKPLPKLKKAAPKKAAPKKAAPKKVAPKKVLPKKVLPKKVLPKKKVAPKKVAPKKIVVKESKGYPSFAARTESFKLGNISGGGNRKPMVALEVADFSDPALQKKRDPAFYAEAAKSRLVKKQEFIIDDGLTVLERKQRGVQDKLLTGLNLQVDKSAIKEVQGVDYFGLSGDRFQLLFIAVFGLFTLVGCLSGNLTF